MAKRFWHTSAVTTVLILALLLPTFQPMFIRAAPPPPVTPAPTVEPDEPQGNEDQRRQPPVPGQLPPDVEQARVRDAMGQVLAKYLDYWGPRYQVAPIEVSIDGEWAHGVAKWQSEARAVSGPIHILAHRTTSGAWQALMPSSDGLYPQWADAVPESLVSDSTREQLRAQAAQVSVLHLPTTVAPPAPAWPTQLEGPYVVPPPAEPIPTPDHPQPETWIAGETSVSGLDKEQRAKMLGVPLEVLEWEQSQKSTQGRNPAFYTYPSSLDWRNANGHDWTTDIRDQQGCGSCVAFGTIGAIESRIKIANANPGLAPDLSESHLFYCGCGQCCNQGWYPGAAMNFARDTGIVDESCFPYQDTDLGCTPCADWQSRVTRISDWNGTGNIADMKQALADHGPIEATFTVYDDFYYYTGGVYRHTWGSVSGGHAITLVGYDDGGGYWIAKNSWDTDWGENGWFRIAYGECGIDDYAYIPTVSGGGNQVQLYSLANYQGSITFSRGVGFSNSPSADSYSMSLPPGWSAKTWRQDNRGGEERCWTESVPNLQDHGWHLAIQSIEVFDHNECPSCEPSDDQVALFVDSDYGGQCVVKGLGHYPDPNSIGLPNDTISSIRVGGNVQATLCEEGNYGGVCETLTGDDSNLSDNSIGNDQVSSARVELRGGNCTPNDDQIALYANTDYGGNCVTLDVGDYPNPSHLGDLGNDNAESIRVGSEVEAILCEHDNYGGRCETFTGDDTDLSDNTIGANIVSSAQVQSRRQPPDPPTLQSPDDGATFTEGDGIHLAWSATGQEYYGEVWGGPGGTIPFGWQSETSENLDASPAGYEYSWHVMARNDGGDSAWSETRTFTVKLAAPSDLQVQTASCSEIDLYWSDNSSYEQGYKVYRNGSYVGQVGADVSSYQDVGLDESTLYSYSVKAYRDSIESDASNTAGEVTPPCSPAQPDLRPFIIPGYPYPVVPSSIQGTHEVNALVAGQPTYFDWHFANSGDAPAENSFYVELWVDTTQHVRYFYPDFAAGEVGGFDDWAITIWTPGWHTVELITDPDQTIQESDEGNNAWEHTFYWAQSAPYLDEMENGPNGWTATGLWHQIDSETSPYPEVHSGSHSWWYGQDATGDFDTGSTNSGELTSPPIYIPSTGYYLRFWYWYETETRGTELDQRWVQVSVDGGPFQTILQLYDDPMAWWLKSPALDLSSYAGHTVQIRFAFDTIDDIWNDYRGWYIDDVEISTTPPPACNDVYEPNDTPAEATTIAYGQALNADMCPGGDYDVYTFTGFAGDKVVIDVDAKSNGSQLDAYVFLLDSDGTSVLAENDDEIAFEVQDPHFGYELWHDGTYYIKVRAWDHPSAGGSDCFYTIHLLTDDVDPSSVALMSPEDGAWLDHALEIVTVDAQDAESGVSRVEFLWHSADWETSDWVWLGTDWDIRDGWSWEMDTRSLVEQHGGSLYVWAFDWANNWAGAGVWDLGIDRTPPSVSVGTSFKYTDAPFRDFWVWWDATDDLAGVADVEIQYRDMGGSWTDLFLDTVDGPITFVGQDGHTYYFRARAQDHAGNQSVYTGGDGDAQHTVNVCDTPPDVYEIDDTVANANWISVDGISQTHITHVEEDEDWTKFHAAAGVVYTLLTTNTGGHADTVLELYDMDGNTLIDSNDDDPERWPASRLDWQPSASGVYYARVYHWDPWAYGCTTEYGLSITTNDQTPPSGNVRINNGELYAESRSVTLYLGGTDEGTGVESVMASNRSDFQGASWTDYAPTLGWTLTTGLGTKTVYVRYRDRAGNVSSTISDDILYYEPVTADFGADVTTGAAPLTVHFSDLSTGPVASWEWDFGDGHKSTLQHPTHIYVNSGAFDVSLTVRLAGEAAFYPRGTDTMTRKGYVATERTIYLPIILRKR